VSTTVGASKRKTVVDIAASIFLFTEHIEYDQYLPAPPFDMMLITIHVLLDSDLFFYHQ
jgi:hypothetical protein